MVSIRYPEGVNVTLEVYTTSTRHLSLHLSWPSKLCSLRQKSFARALKTSSLVMIYVCVTVECSFTTLFWCFCVTPFDPTTNPLQTLYKPSTDTAKILDFGEGCGMKKRKVQNKNF